MIEAPKVSPALMLQAKETIARTLSPTPLIRLNSASENGVWLKCESFQPTGSFKIRGATFKLSTLTRVERESGVVAYSTGNHAQAVAYACRAIGVQCTIVMSADAPEEKIEATCRLDAQVIMAEPSSAARRELAESIAQSSKASLIAPYDDFDVIAGQSTIAAELATQFSDLSAATVFIPIGGGGLIAGIASALRHHTPGCRIIGVEPAARGNALQSFKTGRNVASASPNMTIADAVRVSVLGDLTFPIIRRHVDDIVQVTDEEIISATLFLHDECKLVSEPAGGIALAAALKSGPERNPKIVIATGGNIALETLCSFRKRAQSRSEPEGASRAHASTRKQKDF